MFSWLLYVSIAFFHFELVLKFCRVALVVYDTTISLQQEVKCIWKGRFSAVTVLYVVIRYGSICHMFFQVFGGFYIFTRASVRERELFDNPT